MSRGDGSWREAPEGLSARSGGRDATLGLLFPRRESRARALPLPWAAGTAAPTRGQGSLRQTIGVPTLLVGADVLIGPPLTAEFGKGRADHHPCGGRASEQAKGPARSICFRGGPFQREGGERRESEEIRGEGALSCRPSRRSRPSRPRSWSPAGRSRTGRCRFR